MDQFRRQILIFLLFFGITSCVNNRKPHVNVILNGNFLQKINEPINPDLFDLYNSVRSHTVKGDNDEITFFLDDELQTFFMLKTVNNNVRLLHLECDNLNKYNLAVDFGSKNEVIVINDIQASNYNRVDNGLLISINRCYPTQSFTIIQLDGLKDEYFFY
ncbi:MAG: hypothetical protein R2792_17295 [Saprospiraceae bacterium]